MCNDIQVRTREKCKTISFQNCDAIFRNMYSIKNKINICTYKKYI